MRNTKSAALAVILLAFAGAAAAQAVGDTVECSGTVGTIIRTEPRAGWDEPFYIVQSRGTPTPYELRCLPKQMRKVVGGPAPAASLREAAASPARPTAAVAPPGGGSLCRVGAKAEGRWGISWYAVTVLAAPNAEGKCRVRFDGYGSMWDSLLVADGLRPSGSGPITRPANPVADTPVPTAGATGGGVPDGTYKCHKISPGGQLMSIGDLTMRGGRGTVSGMPAGWTVRSISLRERNARGQTVVAFDYRSAAGFNDRLDCVG